jgi:glycerol-3-phosphate dehydrogenase
MAATSRQTGPRPAGTREQPLDLIVIGGGINGAGIARDAAMRGLHVTLCEMRDLATGATWASSGMIHGGLRYLTSDPSVTRLSCLDSGFIQQIAPHLIFRIPFLLPWQEGGIQERVMLELAEVFFTVYDRYQPLKRGLTHTRLTREEALRVEPGLAKNLLGAITMDEWGIDAQRLTLINALDASEHGAEILTYHKVEGLIRDGGRVLGVRLVDRLSGARRELFASRVINAGGPWSMGIAANEGASSVKVRPGKGVHLITAGRVTNYAVLAKAVDGRQIFICPQQNTTLIGTTDDDYYGDLERIPVLEDEIEYLLQGVESIFPTIRRYPLIGTTVGCRATLHGYGKYEDDLSRAHRIYDHRSEGLDGFFSIAGGKLATYRIMAQEATDALMQSLGRSVACETATRALPGGEHHGLMVRDFVEAGVSAVAGARILYRHGSRADQILELVRETPSMAAIVDPAEPVIEAELRYCLRNEAVVQFDDLKRRCRLGVGGDFGVRSILPAARIFCEERGLAPSCMTDVALGFMQSRWEDRRGLMTGGAAMAETRAAHALLAGLGGGL